MQDDSSNTNDESKQEINASVTSAKKIKKKFDIFNKDRTCFSQNLNSFIGEQMSILTSKRQATEIQYDDYNLEQLKVSLDRLGDRRGHR